MVEDDHLELKKKAEKYLDKYHDEGKQPAANMEVKKLVGELIMEEEQLERKLRSYF